MGTQALLDKIEAASAEQIATIKTEAAKTVEAISGSAETEVAKIAADATAAADKAAAAVERAVLAKARQSGKLVVQTARRDAFDEIMIAAEKKAVDGDADKAQQWADARADLELHLSKQLS